MRWRNMRESDNIEDRQGQSRGASGSAAAESSSGASGWSPWSRSACCSARIRWRS